MKKQVKSLSSDQIVPASLGEISIHQFDEFQLSLFDYLMTEVHFSEAVLLSPRYFSPFRPVQQFPIAALLN